jgi:predicted glutamine amidotransferase
LFRPAHSIIDQSLHARLGEYTTNGHGFGIGWYGDSKTPAVFKSTHPAWNNRDLREVAGQIRTPLLFAHVRSSTGPRCSAATVTRSRTAGGCGCTTGRSPGSRR